MSLDAKTILAPGVPDLAALGAERADDVLGGALSEEARAELVSEDAESRLVRCPLPGTPGDDGRLTASPCGAGTGFVFVRRYRAVGWRRLLATRFQAPRSTSLAAREWNLVCALRAEGVATAEPLALVEAPRRTLAGALFAVESAFVTRELEGLRAAPEWFAALRADPALGSVDERRGVRALARFLGQLVKTSVELPELEAAHLFLGEPQHFTERMRGLRVSALPRVALASVRGGQFVKGNPLERAAVRGGALAERLMAAGTDAGWSQRSLWTVFARLTQGLARAERRRLAERILARKAHPGREGLA